MRRRDEVAVWRHQKPGADNLQYLRDPRVCCTKLKARQNLRHKQLVSIAALCPEPGVGMNRREKSNSEPFSTKTSLIPLDPLLRIIRANGERSRCVADDLLV